MAKTFVTLSGLRFVETLMLLLGIVSFFSLSSCAFVSEEFVQLNFRLNFHQFSTRGEIQGDGNESTRIVGAIMVFDINDPLFIFYKDYPTNITGVIDFDIDQEVSLSFLNDQFYYDDNLVPSPFFPTEKYLPFNILLTELDIDSMELGTILVPTGRALRAIIHLYLLGSIPEAYAKSLEQSESTFLVSFMSSDIIVFNPGDTKVFTFDPGILETAIVGIDIQY